MQELTPQVFLETYYAGITVGLIKWQRGLILIDTPFRAEDIRSWRSTIASLGGGIDRLLVNLDAHQDRTLGARAMECTIIGHEKMNHVFRNRPVTFKSQSPETGAEWERYNNLGSIRWAPPEITFTDQLLIHYDDKPIVLEYHPGPSACSIWINLISDRIVFVGDTVVPNQPPFLANADLQVWKSMLQELLSPKFQDYIVISGRSGLVTTMDVRGQFRFLEKVDQKMVQLIEKKAPPEETTEIADDLLADISPEQGDETLYRQRLRWGLRQYYLKQCQLTDPENEE